jgi:DNA-binding beta-propeller fold protein YncE
MISKIERSLVMRKNILLLLVFLGVLGDFAWGEDPTVYVVNNLGETLSKINLKTDVVTNDFLTLGSAPESAPNQIVIRDSLAYVVNSVTSEIQIINLKNETTCGYIDMGEGRNPFWMAFSDPDTQHVWVTCSMVDSLFKVDVKNKILVAGYPIGVWPEGILILDSLAYVCITAFDIITYEYGQGKVVIFDTRSNSIIKELNVGTNPQYITLDNQGEIYVSCTGDYWSAWGIVYVIDSKFNEIKDSIQIGGSPGQIAISPDDVGWLAAGGWSAEGLIYLFDSRVDTVIMGAVDPMELPGDSGIIGLVDFQDSTVLACAFQVDEVIKVDPSGSVLKRYLTGDGPIHLSLNYIYADANGDFISDAVDAIYMINYLFRDGPPPPKPVWRADPNCDCRISVTDIVYLISYHFRNGPAPRHGCAYWTP